MFDKIFCLVIAIALLSSMGTAATAAAVTLTDAEFDKVTAGTGVGQATPVIASFLTNGANGARRGESIFPFNCDPVTQTNIPTALNLFTVHCGD